MPERIWNIVRLNVDGIGLERWFLKTLINVTLSGEHRIGPNSITPGEPSGDLVEIAFGLRQFAANAGLYVSAELGEKVTFEDRVTIIPFFDQKNECVLGATFYFRGLRFILCLLEQGFTGSIHFVHKEGGKSSFARPLRHIKKLKFTVGPSQKRVSHVVHFKW